MRDWLILMERRIRKCLSLNHDYCTCGLNRNTTIYLPSTCYYICISSVLILLYMCISSVLILLLQVFVFLFLIACTYSITVYVYLTTCPHTTVAGIYIFLNSHCFHSSYYICVPATCMSSRAMTHLLLTGSAFVRSQNE
jgi:hypothetical protein